MFYWTHPEAPRDPESLEPDPREAGRGVSYRCIAPGCGWTGRGGAKAFDHHRSSRHHPIVNQAGQRQIFGCCQQGAEPIERESELNLEV
jgi:hypothetical protein